MELFLKEVSQDFADYFMIMQKENQLGLAEVGKIYEEQKISEEIN
jgi:hypothetical protein